MDEVVNYINEVLGIRVTYKKVAPEKLKNLPFFLAKGYDFGEIRLYNQKIVLLIVKDDFTTEVLRTHITKIQSVLDAVVVAVIPQVDAYKRLRLIEKRVPFIVPGRQMYMPNLLISLKEYGNNRVEDRQPENMQPAAQLILLYHLQVEALEGLNLGTIAQKLSYNPMTVTRAAFYFHNIGLCKIEGTKEKFLKFEKTKRELWDIAETKMTNPINKTQFYTGYSLDQNLKKTNINALAYYTDLNDEQVEFFAMRPGYGRFIGGLNLKPIDPMEGNVCIEEWKYDPALLTKTEYIDPLSLYLCFRENKNERIEMALEKLLEQIQW
jgi:hypothetical protein